jgi:hypothetical protein
MFWMIRNASGNKDAVLTMAVAGFVFCVAKMLVVGVTIQLVGRTIDFGTIDGGTIAAILTPTLGAYVGRRYTDRKYGGDPLPGAEPVKAIDKGADSAAAKK